MSEDVGINHHLVHSRRLTILSVLHPWRWRVTTLAGKLSRAN